MVNRIAFLISLYDLSLLVYRDAHGYLLKAKTELAPMRN